MKNGNISQEEIMKKMAGNAIVKYNALAILFDKTRIFNIVQIKKRNEVTVDETVVEAKEKKPRKPRAP